MNQLKHPLAGIVAASLAGPTLLQTAIAANTAELEARSLRAKFLDVQLGEPWDKATSDPLRDLARLQACLATEVPEPSWKRHPLSLAVECVAMGRPAPTFYVVYDETTINWEPPEWIFPWSKVAIC